MFQILFAVLQTSKKHCRKKCGLIHKNFRTSVFGTEALTAKFTQIHCFTSSQPWIMRGDKREFVILGKSGWGPRGALLSPGLARPGLTTPFSASKTNPSLSHLGIITLTSLNHHSHTKHSLNSNLQCKNSKSPQYWSSSCRQEGASCKMLNVWLIFPPWLAQIFCGTNLE